MNERGFESEGIKSEIAFKVHELMDKFNNLNVSIRDGEHHSLVYIGLIDQERMTQETRERKPILEKLTLELREAMAGVTLSQTDGARFFALFTSENPTLSDLEFLKIYETKVQKVWDILVAKGYDPTTDLWT